MSSLHIDFETYSTVDLRASGVDRYAADPNTGVWCMAWAFDAGEPELWEPGQPLPARVRKHVEAGGTVVAHNVHFELAIWNKLCVPRFGWPTLDHRQCDDTMARAYACALPGSLDQVTEAIGVTQKKDKAGHRLMMRMARPRRTEADGTLVWWNEADKKKALFDYCAQDVRAEQDVDAKLPALIPQERKLWELDYAINQRGIHIDVPTVRRSQLIIGQYQRKLNERLARITNYEVSTAKQVTAFRQWLGKRGVRTPNVRSDTVDRLLTQDLPDDVREALELRQEVGRNATAKLGAMLACVDSDNRARGLLGYHVANTGRWAGRRVQPQNLLRPVGVFDEDYANVLKAIELINGPKPIEALHEAFGSVGDAVGSTMRSMICAENGKLIAADFSAIEGRVLQWLAGAEKGLQMYRDNDAGIGPEPYIVAASAIFGIPAEKINKKDRERLIGKVAELALGYQGAAGAFSSMAKNYGIEVDERAGTVSGDIVIDDVVKNWRKGNRQVVNLWYNLEDAAKEAMTSDRAIRVGKVAFRRRGTHLVCRLPSGRLLVWPYAELVTKFGRTKLTYYGINTYTRKWGRQDTYGGKLAENITQAVARDLLAEALIRLEGEGYPIVLHVHDEAVAETAINFGSVKEMEQIMSTLPTWAEGCPVVASGWEGERYRK